MMNNQLTALKHYYDKQDEMTRECLLALKHLILSVDNEIVHTRKYRIPFFYYKDLKLAFLWVYRKKIVLGFVEDRKTLITPENRKRKDSISTLEFKPADDLPSDRIRQELILLISVYKRGLPK